MLKYYFVSSQRLVVCLEESLYIHNIRDMKVLHTIRDTPPNPQGLCALSPNNDFCYLAYPGSSTIGEVQIFDAYNLVILLDFKSKIKLYDSRLIFLASQDDDTSSRLPISGHKFQFYRHVTGYGVGEGDGNTRLQSIRWSSIARVPTRWDVQSKSIDRSFTCLFWFICHSNGW